ncbi:hypothetical protein DFP72DRAFT_1179362, partial [Ephemerocybe angulata]
DRGDHVDRRDRGACAPHLDHNHHHRRERLSAIAISEGRIVDEERSRAARTGSHKDGAACADSGHPTFPPNSAEGLGFKTPPVSKRIGPTRRCEGPDWARRFWDSKEVWGTGDG